MKKLTLFTTFPVMLLGIVMSLCLVAMPVSAQTPVEDLFELDGNAIDETVGSETAPDDWGRATDTDSWGYVAGPAVDGTNPGGGAHISAFINDPNGATGLDDIFHGGGSKDDEPILKWKWTVGGPPDKDDLLGVGAAAYLPGLTELLIYDFGSLYADNGSSSIGNWFFKKDIGPCSDGTFGVVDGNDPNRPCLPKEDPPIEPHTIGDVLVISENTDGGKTTNVSVYIWVAEDAAACAAVGGSFVAPKDNLCLVGAFAASTCGTPSADDFVCGVMNKQGEPTEAPDTYGFQSKFPPPPPYPGPAAPPGTDGIGEDDYPELSFFESGINISEMLGSTECFSSFLKNTRTAHGPRSRLKDFAGGAFELCGIEATKTCDAALNNAGDQVDVLFDGTVSNTGVVALEIVLYDDASTSEISAVCYDDNPTNGACDPGDSVPGDLDLNPTGDEDTATFTLGPGETVLYEGFYVVTGPISSLEFTDTITADAWIGDAAVDSAEATAECSETGTPNIAVNKSCIGYFDNGDTFRAEIIGGAENTGNVKLVYMTLSDPFFEATGAPLLTVVTDSNGNGIVDGGEPEFDGDLIPGEKLAFKATFTSTSVTSHSNTMTVAGENVFDASDTVSDFDPAQCGIAPLPDLSITKVCDESINGTGVRLVQRLDVVSVEVGNIIKVKNIGDEVLNPVEVSDSETGLTIVKADWTCTAGVCSGPLDPDEEITFTQTYLPDGANIIGALMNPGSVFFNNTATAKGRGVLSKTLVEPDPVEATCKICPPCPTCN